MPIKKIDLTFSGSHQQLEQVTTGNNNRKLGERGGGCGQIIDNWDEYGHESGSNPYTSV